MKKLLLLLMVMPMLFSCNEWLNVTPEEEIDEEDLFADGEGFRNALNGIYSRISGTDMYGQELSWGFLDVLAHYYDFAKMNQYGVYPLAYEGDYDNDDVRGVLEQVWQGAYSSIANCNNLIQNIDGADVTLFFGRESERNMLKGEALALRAFLHFDLLRLFAPAAVKNTSTGYVDAGNGEVYLPYCDVHPAVFQNREKVDDYLDKVVRDLKEAKTLLATFDTISDVRKSQLSTTNRLFATAGVQEDLFYCFRGFRMNYYAATAMLARVYNYMGELELAAEQAQEVVDCGYFPITGSYMYAKPTDDVIFGLSNKKLTERFQTYYTGTSKGLFLSKASIDEVFTATDMYDYRGYYYGMTTNSETGSGYYVSNKYLPTDEGGVRDELIPVIRTVEMQFILGEYYASIGDFATATSLMTSLKQAFYSYSMVSIGSLEEYQDVWLNQAWRSFIGEGQMFYLYKKLGVKIYPEMTDEAFVFDIPYSEDVILNQ